MNSGYFRLNSQQTSKGKLLAQLSMGDVVSIRRIECSPKRQEMLSYACLAILRSYFTGLKGVGFYSFYESLDRIVVLEVWDSIQSALAFVKNAEDNPALPFWKGAGAKQLKYHVRHVKYHVCHIVHATDI